MKTELIFFPFCRKEARRTNRKDYQAVETRDVTKIHKQEEAMGVVIRQGGREKLEVHGMQ